MYINKRYILLCLEWNQNIKNSFPEQLSHISLIHSCIFNSKLITIYHEQKCHKYTLFKQLSYTYLRIFNSTFITTHHEQDGHLNNSRFKHPSYIYSCIFNGTANIIYHEYKGYFNTDTGIAIEGLKMFLIYQIINVKFTTSRNIFHYLRMFLPLLYTKTEKDNLRPFISLEKIFPSRLVLIISYPIVLDSTFVLTTSYANYMNKSKKKITAFKNDNDTFCCRHKLISCPIESLNTISLCYLMYGDYLKGSKIDKIFRTFINHFLVPLSYKIEQYHGWTRMKGTSWRRLTLRLCRAGRWSQQRLRRQWNRSRRTSLRSGLTGTSRRVRTTWTIPEDNELEELEEDQTKEEIFIIILILIFFYQTYNIYSLFMSYSIVDMLDCLVLVLEYHNTLRQIPFQISNPYRLFNTCKFNFLLTIILTQIFQMFGNIYSQMKHALSMLFAYRYNSKYKREISQKIFRPCLNPIIVTVYFIRNHMRPMNHYTVRVCGLKSLFDKSNFSHNGKKGQKTKCVYLTLRRLNTINIRALDNYLKGRLVHDIEKNPGPVSNIVTVITLNCRGLNQISKFRLLLNKAAMLQQLNPNTIIMLQETMVIDTTYIELAWKGKYIFTPGTGNSKGCITLLDNDTIIYNNFIIGNRGHYAQIQLCNQKKVTIFNIYAPNGYTQEKRAYFENLIDLLNRNAEDIILAGDFNLTMQGCDRHNHQTNAGEQNIANYLSIELDQLGLIDHLKDKRVMTWKKGNSMSKLDRIYTRLNRYTLTSVTTDWTIIDSDHTAVVATFNSEIRHKKGIRPYRLHSVVVNNPDTLNELCTYLREQLQTLSPEANPHTILEFAKMTIHTKAMQLSKRQLNIEEEHLKFINEDIRAHESLLLHTHDTNEQIEINLIIQTRINERDEILEKQGKRLAWSARSKWYNEGEKSNKYFLNLLKARTARNEMTSLKINDIEVNDPEAIEHEVNKYYNDLYNSSFKTVENNDFLNEMFEVDSELGNLINKPISLAELWMALKPLKDTAPGPDGILHSYLRKLWHIIGPIILNAWNYSIQINKMPPSHYISFLKLIPKVGKDSRDLKNWRPITLSNCDHKLITRIYNNRLLQCISDKIINTQTAYIRT